MTEETTDIPDWANDFFDQFDRLGQDEWLAIINRLEARPDLQEQVDWCGNLARQARLDETSSLTREERTARTSILGALSARSAALAQRISGHPDENGTKHPRTVRIFRLIMATIQLHSYLARVQRMPEGPAAIKGLREVYAGLVAVGPPETL